MEHADTIYIVKWAIVFCLMVIASLTGSAAGKYIYLIVKKHPFATEQRLHCMMHLLFSVFFFVLSSLMLYAIVFSPDA